MHQKIVDIQNSFWKAYTNFRESRDMRTYNKEIEKVVRRYVHDPVMRNFCEGLVMSWAPVINGMKEWS